MEINTYVCGSCAGTGISNLGHHKNAVDAMSDFCRKVGLTTSRYSSAGTIFNKMPPFFVFIAGPEEPGHRHSKSWVRYGTEFAEFIRENDLGDITTLPARLNLAYHPDTTCQVWLWGPDQEKIQAWWRQQKQAAMKPVMKPLKSVVVKEVL